MMKRWLCAVLALCICLIAVPVAASPSGDMDRSNSVDMLDTLSLYAAVSGTKTASASAAARGDVDRDGVLSVLDALLLYAASSGQAVSLPTDVAFDASYVMLPVPAYEMAPLVVITSEAEWNTFIRSDAAVDPACYAVNWSYSTQALIGLPINGEACVAAVTADDESLYVSLVVSENDGTAQGYAFVTVDKAMLEDRDVTVTAYRDEEERSPEAPVVAEGVSGSYKRIGPTVIGDVEALASFAKAYYQKPLTDVAALNGYDDAFFEENLLVWAGYVAPVLGHDMKVLSCELRDSAIFVHRALTVWPYDTVGFAAVQAFPAMLTLSREGYSGQEAVLIDHMQVVKEKSEHGLPLDYEVLYTETVSHRYDELIGGRYELIDSYETFLAEAQQDDLLGHCYNTVVDEAFFEDNVLIALFTEDLFVMENTVIDGVYRNGNEIRVLRLWNFPEDLIVTTRYGRVLIRVAASDAEAVTDVILIDHSPDDKHYELL